MLERISVTDEANAKLCNNTPNRTSGNLQIKASC